MSIASLCTHTFTSTVITTDIIIKYFRETLIIYTYKETRALISCRGNHTRIINLNACVNSGVLR